MNMSEVIFLIAYNKGVYFRTLRTLEVRITKTSTLYKLYTGRTRVQVPGLTDLLITTIL